MLYNVISNLKGSITMVGRYRFSQRSFNALLLFGSTRENVVFIDVVLLQPGRSPKVVAFFSATNFSSNIIELLQLLDAIQI